MRHRCARASGFRVLRTGEWAGFLLGHHVLSATAEPPATSHVTVQSLSAHPSDCIAAGARFWQSRGGNISGPETDPIPAWHVWETKLNTSFAWVLGELGVGPVLDPAKLGTYAGLFRV